MAGKLVKELSDAEYGKHIREMNTKYYLRAKAILNLKEEALKKAGVVITEAQIAAEVKRLASTSK